MRLIPYIIMTVVICSHTVPVMAQSGGLEDYSAGNGTDEALEGATPTDNVNEIGIGNYNTGNLGAGEDNYGVPATNDDSSGLDINNNYGGDMFGDGEDKIPGLDDTSNGGAAAAPSALGDNAYLGTDPAAAKAGENKVNSTAPVNNVNSQLLNQPQQTAPQQLVPQQTVPEQTFNQNANAEGLMNELNQQGANSTNSAGGVVPTGQPAEESQGDLELVPSDTDLVVLDQPEGPVAPPLPPPNEFAGAPPVPGSLRQMADGEAPEIYQVEYGDTLFDICDQLLDEGGYWPKLWAMNPEIKNPHFIFPGMRLKFYPGDDESPPYLQVVAEEDIIPIDKGDLDESELIREAVTIAADPVDAYQIEVIGPSEVQDDLFAESFRVGGRQFQAVDLVIRVPVFLYKNEKEALGYVIGGREGDITAGPSREALVESTGGVSNGSTYTVLRYVDEVSNPESGDFVGYRYSFVANIQINRKVDDDVSIGMVKDSRLQVRPDDIVVNYIATTRTIPDSTVGTLSSANANIVGFDYGESAIGGKGSCALIDKGNGDGVSAGMYLPVFATPSNNTSLGNSNLPEDYQKVGVMRIIDATDAGAVGYIVQSDREMRVGDRAGKG